MAMVESRAFSFCLKRRSSNRGSVDHADRNYRPILGLLRQIRFRFIVSLLPRRLVRRMLVVVVLPDEVEREPDVAGDPHEDPLGRLRISP